MGNFIFYLVSSIVNKLLHRSLPKSVHLSLPEKCPCLELCWSVFSSIRTEYEEVLHISPYSVRMWEKTDQNNFKDGHILCSV